jgi:hypothetical protein
MMKLEEVKYVKIGEQNFPIKFTNRAMIEYEALTGESFPSLKNTERRIQLFYFTAKAGALSKGEEFNYTLDQFMDFNYFDILYNFVPVIIEMLPTPEEGAKQKKVK